VGGGRSSHCTASRGLPFKNHEGQSSPFIPSGDRNKEIGGGSIRGKKNGLFGGPWEKYWGSPWPSLFRRGAGGCAAAFITQRYPPKEGGTYWREGFAAAEGESVKRMFSVSPHQDEPSPARNSSYPGQKGAADSEGS